MALKRPLVPGADGRARQLQPADDLDPAALPVAAANTFLAGPASGAAARPAQRTVVSADLPALLLLKWNGLD